MTEEELRGMMQDAARKVKEESVPAMTGVLMDTFQHGLEEGIVAVRLQLQKDIK